jgi:DNA-directed RNA polymerase specialized sigma24 family protein
MPADSKKALIAWLFAKHRGRLHTFLGRRVRRQEDIEELVQEVYARMLAVRDIENVRNPEGYLHGEHHLVYELRPHHSRARPEFPRSTRFLEIEVPILEQLLPDALPAQPPSIIGLDLQLSLAAQVAQVPPGRLEIASTLGEHLHHHLGGAADRSTQELAGEFPKRRRLSKNSVATQPIECNSALRSNEHAICVHRLPRAICRPPLQHWRA